MSPELFLKLQALQRAVSLIVSMKDRKQLEYKEAMGLLEVINDYNYALGLLDDYDYKRLKISKTSKEEKFVLTYEFAMEAVNELKKKFGASEMIAESKPSEREIIVTLVVNLINKNN